MIEHNQEASITLTYRQSGMLLAALDYALCHQGKPCEEDLRELRPIVDKMASTFGFSTERLDMLFKGQKVDVPNAAFTTHRTALRWEKKAREARRRLNGGGE